MTHKTYGENFFVVWEDSNKQLVQACGNLDAAQLYCKQNNIGIPPRAWLYNLYGTLSIETRPRYGNDK